jgi:protein required for attachment to host cells
MATPPTWIVIADGARARVFAHAGPGKGLQAVLDNESADARAHIGDIVSDRAGRTFDSAGEGRHGYEPPVDPKREAQLAFARSLARALEDGLNRHRFERLVIAAPPRALGDLRACLSKAVAAAVVHELPKDLTNLPDHALADHLGEVVRL